MRVLWLGGNNFSTPKSSILEGGGIVNEWRGSANGGGGGSRGLFFDDKASIDDFLLWSDEVALKEEEEDEFEEMDRGGEADGDLGDFGRSSGDPW